VEKRTTILDSLAVEIDADIGFCSNWPN